MNKAKWLAAVGLSGLSLTCAVAQAETVAINQNGSLVEMCASAEKMVAHDAAMMPWIGKNKLVDQSKN